VGRRPCLTGLFFEAQGTAPALHLYRFNFRRLSLKEE
jgi:hypothetical protein